MNMSAARQNKAIRFISALRRRFLIERCRQGPHSIMPLYIWVSRVITDRVFSWFFFTVTLLPLRRAETTKRVLRAFRGLRNPSHCDAMPDALPVLFETFLT